MITASALPDRTLEAEAEALQKKLGKPLDRARVPEVQDLLEKAESHADDEQFPKALASLAAIQRPAPKPPTSLRRLIDQRLAAIEETVAYEAEELLETEAPTAQERALAKRLFEAVDVPVYGRHLPIRGRLKAFLEGG